MTDFYFRDPAKPDKKMHLATADGDGSRADKFVLQVALADGVNTDGAVLIAPIQVDEETDTVLAGQITVTTAGTAVTGPSTPLAIQVAIKAHPDNADTVWWGNNGAGDVTSSNGFPLDPGEGIVLQGNLNQYRFDANSNGDKICWGIVQR